MVMLRIELWDTSAGWMRTIWSLTANSTAQALVELFPSAMQLTLFRPCAGRQQVPFSGSRGSTSSPRGCRPPAWGKYLRGPALEGCEARFYLDRDNVLLTLVDKLSTAVLQLRPCGHPRTFVLGSRRIGVAG